MDPSAVQQPTKTGLPCRAKRWAGGVAAVGLLFLMAALFAQPASAHALLEETTPAQGSTVDTAPKEIRLRFIEGVDIPDGAIELYDSSGARLDVGAAHHPDGRPDEVAASVPDLGRGSYVVSWKATSADSHPINGAFTFAVGAASGSTEGLVAALATGGVSRSLAVLYGVLWWSVIAALAVVVGALALGATVPAVRAARPVDVLVGRVAVFGAVASVVGIGLQGAYSAGLGLADVVSPSVWGEILGTRYGLSWLARAVVFAALAGLVLRRTRTAEAAEDFRGESPAEAAATALLSVALVATVTVAGHAMTGRWVPLAVVADLVHTTAMAIWMGGLVLLAWWAVRRAEPADGLAAVKAFSPVALGAVAALVVTGTLQGIRQTGSADALTGTTYGRLLIAKVVVVLAAVGGAWLSRRFLRRWEVTPDQAVQPRPSAITRSLWFEVIAVGVALAITSALSTTAPGIEARSEPFRQTVVGTGGLTEIWLDPARSGTTALHVTFTNSDGSIPQVAEVTAELRLPSRDLGPLESAVPRYRGLPNHFSTDHLAIPFPGTWQITVRARVGDFDERTATVDAPVR